MKVGRGLLAVVLMLILAQRAWADPLRVAVATNFRGTLQEIGSAFSAQTSIEVVLSSAATGVLVQQVMHGAPFDVLFSADTRHVDLLEDRGLALAETRRTYALGRLVLWGPQLGRPPVTADLFQPGLRIGLANPRVAPYGIAAREVLQHLDAWKPDSPDLVRANSVAGVLQLASKGLLDLAFVGRAQLQRYRGVGHGSDMLELPSGLHSPIVQQAVVLKNATSPDRARELLAFVTDGPGRALILGDGYELPPIGRPG